MQEGRSNTKIVLGLTPIGHSASLLPNSRHLCPYDPFPWVQFFGCAGPNGSQSACQESEPANTYMHSPAQVDAFVTLFASGKGGRSSPPALTAVAHDARRRLDYSERQRNGQAAPTLDTDSPPAVERSYAARRQESGIFHDAADLFLPACDPILGAKLSELEQEVQAATPIHACFSDAQTFSILLSSWTVVSVRLADDGTHICKCMVDRRLATTMSDVERDKKLRV